MSCKATMSEPFQRESVSLFCRTAVPRLRKKHITASKNIHKLKVYDTLQAFLNLFGPLGAVPTTKFAQKTSADHQISLVAPKACCN